MHLKRLGMILRKPEHKKIDDTRKDILDGFYE